MGSSSGTTTSSGGSGLQEEMNLRKKRRMISNRESARRSRMRKQKHLDELVTQLSQLKTESNNIMSSISMTSQSYMNVEAENSVLRAQVGELTHRLQSLNEIIDYMKQPVGFAMEEYRGDGNEFLDDSLSYLYACQPILASADIMTMY